jgi:uncharacterized membrane protein YccC
MQLTEVLWIAVPSGSTLAPAGLAELAAQHHGITLLAMVLAGLIAMLSSFAVLEPKLREQALTMVGMPIPMLATMALSIEIEPHRTIGIVLLAVVIGFGSYLRKFGPRAFLYGIMLFIGYLFGFLSHGALTEGQLGWIAVILWIAVAVNILLKVVIGRPLDRGRLQRTANAFRARCQGVLAATAAVLDAEGLREREKTARILHRRLTRLNETALVIDGLIADPGHTSLGAAAFDAHDELFELELLMQNIARAVERLAEAELPPRMGSEVRGWLAELRAGRGDRAAAAAAAFRREQNGTPTEPLQQQDGEVAARIHYIAGAIIDLAAAVEAWPRHRSLPDEETEWRFESPVTLIFGELPGSSFVSAAAADPGSRHRGTLLSRLGIDPPAQIAIRLMIAVGTAAAIGSIVSEQHFYWAVIAVFISFMGANTSGEQVTKAINRVAGTLLGILLGSLLAHAIGLSTWSLAVIILALGFGIYFMPVSYALMVVGITVMVSQLYEQLGEYSNHLLVLRLEETAIGAAVAMAAALLIFPVDTRRTATVAAHRYLESLGELLGRTSERVSSRARDDRHGARLSSASRGLDHANQQLLAASRPLRHTPFRRGRLEHNLALFSQIAHQARNLVATVGRGGGLDPDLAASVVVALEREREKVAGIERTLAGSDGETDCRSEEDLIAPLDRSLAAAGVGPDDYERRLLRRIDRLDEAVAELDRNLRAPA